MLIRVVAGLVMLLATGYLIRIIAGYTECDRTDCGPVEPVLTLGMRVALGVLLLVIAYAFVRLGWRAWGRRTQS